MGGYGSGRRGFADGKPTCESYNVDELVPFAYTPTRFGGRRQWLRCLKCGRGCRKIYGGRWFRCLQCHGLGTPQPGNRPTSIAPTEAGSGSATPGGAPLRVTSSRRSRSACVGRYGSAGRGSQPFMPWPKKCELLTAHEPPVAPLLAPFGRPTTPMSLAAPPPGRASSYGYFPSLAHGCFVRSRAL